ncbi:MAG: 2-amino-4-hydroxy-6-hydroxymethyldihydropteridine diphosphokinase [Bacteroides sp.]
MTACLLCIGSNDCREKNLQLARRRLQSLFPAIRFATLQYTEPLHFTNPARFANQVAVLETDCPKAEIIRLCKEIEREAGRQPGDKQIEKVSLDIDLLLYGSEVLKPEDLQRDYVVKGQKEILKQS